MKYIYLIVVGFLIGCSTIIASGNNKPEVLNYLHWKFIGEKDRMYEGVWIEKKISEITPYKHELTEGVYVEMPHGTTGLHPISGILVPYDKFKEHVYLCVYNKEKNIALLSYDRHNICALSIGTPDADEIIRRHGFKCSSLDVARMLRIMGD